MRVLKTKRKLLKWERYVQKTFKLTKHPYSDYYHGHAILDVQWYARFHKWPYIIRNPE